MADEVEAAKAATPGRGEDTIFGKIINGVIPTDFIYQDDKVKICSLCFKQLLISPFHLQCVAFRDINPQAPVHFLVVPKQFIPTLSDAKDSDGEVMN